MASNEEGAPGPDAANLRGMAVRQLVTELARKASVLARKEIALAKSEAKEDLRTEIKMASGLGVAGVCALCTLNLLLVAVVLGLLGLSRVKRGVPPVPKEAVDSVKDDVKAFKGVGHYDR
jgi:hypothetical protein